jgi:hypothetical protein
LVSALYSINKEYTIPKQTQYSLQNVKFTMVNIPKEIIEPQEKKEIVQKIPKQKKPFKEMTLLIKKFNNL